MNKTYSRRNKGRRLLLPALCVIFTCIAGEARTLTSVALDSAMGDTKTIFFGKGDNPSEDSTLNMIRRFYEDQFRHFQDPMAPYFLFMSRDADLAMGVGGCVRMRAYYDWGGAIQSPGFAPYLIPMTKDPASMNQLATTPAGTALFFRVIGRNKKLGNYQLYIEANFNGYQARDFHLKKAYGQINDWTVGYTNSTFSDPSALPPAVDASGPNSKMSATTVLIRWLHAFKHGWSMAASVESPTSNMGHNDAYTKNITSYVPDIAAFGQYSWGDDAHVRLAGILRFLPYRSIKDARNFTVPGWGLQLSGRWAPDPHWTIYGMVNGGEGYSSLGGDLMMGHYDLQPEPERPWRMYAPGSIGGYAGIQYNIRHNIFLSATYGAMRYLPKDRGYADEYKTGMYMAANIFWYMTPRISCGAEFNLGSRENMDGKKAWARRAEVMAQFSF